MLLLLGLTAVGCQKDNDDNDDDEIITVDSLTTEYTDKLKLTASYKNKDFLADGIGEVTLLRVVDGDTAHFLNKKGDTIKIRFLNINTPESTGVIAAWGKKPVHIPK